ncbi:hypothetical protein [Bradyrhizobium liaoningense]
MGFKLVGRADYCKLIDLPVEQLNALRRRDQIPFVPPPELPEEIANERGYEASSALYLIIANELADRYEISRDSAAAIALKALVVRDRWEDIAATSANVASGKKPSHDILFAVIDWTGLGSAKQKRSPRPMTAVGTLAEIAKQYPDARHLLAISVTQCAALMRHRAAKAGIDISEIWEA